MFVRLKSGWVIAGLVVLVLASISAACEQVAPTLLPRLTPRQTDDPVYQLADSASANADRSATSGADGDATTPVAGVSGSTVGRTVAAHKGSILDLLPMVGRVAGQDEITLKFASSGRVTAIAVAPGATVEEGQVLVETGADTVKSQLDEAQAELETAQIRLQQGRAQADADAQARQRDGQRQKQDAAAARRASAADAEAALHRAEADLATVRQGPSSVDTRTAEAAIAAAHSASQKAEAELTRLASGPDPVAVRTAQTALSQAESVADRAQADLERLTRGTDPNDLRAGERDVQRAQNALKFAQSIKLDPKATSKDVAEHDQAIAQAQLDVQDAQDRLAKLKQPPDEATVAIAKRTRDDAIAAVAVARAQLDALKQGPTQDVLDQASAAVDAAHATEQNAQDRMDALLAHPTPDEVRAAQDRVTAAQATLNRINSSSDPAATSPNDPGTAYNLVLIEKDVVRIQARIDGLQKDLANTRLIAPFAGTVTSVQVRTGDQLSPGSPAITLAKAGDPYVRVELSDKDLSKLSVGQSATIDLTGAGIAQPVHGSLSAIVTANKAGGDAAQVALFQVQWPADKPIPAFGTPAQVQVVVGRSDNALLVPKKALHAAGQRQYLQVQQGTVRRIANVEVGILGKDDAQILGGLNEGQLVVVP